MVCNHCHQEADEDAVYCGNCGNKLTGAATVTHTHRRTAVPQKADTRADDQTGATPIKDDNRPVVAVVTGAAGLVGWMIPILGVILGVVAVAFGTMSLKRIKKRLAIAGTSMGCLAIVLSLLAFAYNAKELQKQNTLKAKPITKVSIKTSKAVDTPCYATETSTGISITDDTGTSNNDCTFTAVDDQAYQYFVKALYNPAVTDKYLQGVAKDDFEHFINAYPGATITSEKAANFAGEASYDFRFSYQGQTGHAVYVMHDSEASAYNIYIIVKFGHGAATKLDEIEANWSWK